jgi:hypothetical protein
MKAYNINDFTALVGIDWADKNSGQKKVEVHPP